MNMALYSLLSGVLMLVLGMILHTDLYTIVGVLLVLHSELLIEIRNKK